MEEINTVYLNCDDSYIPTHRIVIKDCNKFGYNDDVTRRF